jgi:hypothetical protein
LSGANITLFYEPNKSGDISVRVVAATHADDRTTPIRHSHDPEEPPLPPVVPRDADG